MQKTARIAGVTVIGLILRVLVIGFAIIFIYNYINPPNKIRQYRDSQRQRDVRLIADKLELYFSSNGVYPSSSGTDNSRQGNNCRGDFGNGWNTNAGLYQALVGAGYLEVLPTDPINNTGFCYTYQGSSCSATGCSRYILWAPLEKAKVNYVCREPRNCSEEVIR